MIPSIQTYVSSATRANTERCDFGHINPGAVVGNLVVVGDHLIGPPFSSARGQPVRKDGVARPYRADVDAAIRIGQERARIVPPSECRVSALYQPQLLQSNKVTYASLAF